MTYDEILSYRAPIGDKPELLDGGRIAEAKRLTDLMSNRSGGFSYVRLGDKDVAFLIDPHGTEFAYSDVAQCIKGTEPHGTPGLLADQNKRLRYSLEKATYVDYWDLQWKDGSVLENLKLNRGSDLHRNPTRKTSFILPTWLEYEFQSYCNGRNVLFCGAEAPLLKALSFTQQFQNSAARFWPSAANAFFFRPVEDGKNPGQNLEAIKSDLKKAIISNQIDTLFLSLGGVAKIICQELAEELKICAFDFGVGMRTLTYAGSGGYTASRATHLIFLYDLPFMLVMDSIRKAFPDLMPEERLAKAHAQLILELQKKEVGWTHSGWEFDFSAENIQRFKTGFSDYKRHYKKLFKYSASTRRERVDFLHFCGKHRLTWEGRLFMIAFQLKALISKIFGSLILKR